LQATIIKPLLDVLTTTTLLKTLPKVLKGFII